MSVKSDAALVVGIISFSIGAISFFVGDDYIIPYLVRGVILLAGAAAIGLTILWPRISTPETENIQIATEHASAGQRERYEKLAKNVFKPLSESSTLLNTIMYESSSDVELNGRRIEQIIKSPYFSEAHKHLSQDLPDNILQPEQLHSKILHYNDELKQFLDGTIPCKVRQTFERIPNITISEDPNNLPDNSILLPYIISHLKKYLLSNRRNNPELFYENGRLSEGHGIVTLAIIPPTLAESMENAIQNLKHDSGIISVLDGSPIHEGLWKRRTDLIENGNSLAEYINDHILFGIERGTYETTCDQCVNL